MAREQRTVAQQVDAAAEDDLVTLVVGAGVAGVTVAQLLRQQGRHPILVERRPDDGHPGYMLALMPMVEPVLDELGVRAGYRNRSQPFDRYGVHDHNGRLVRVDSMGQLLDRYGDYRGIGRGELLDCLTAQPCPVSHATTVIAIDEGRSATGRTIVTLDERGVRHSVEVDLVVIADGIHSRTRGLVLDEAEVEVVDTGWSGWVAWADADDDMDLGEEVWGNGFFVGLYPVLGSLGTFVGGPTQELVAGPAAFVSRVRAQLRESGPRVDRVLDAVAADPDPYLWPMTDCRAPRWTTAGTALLGDAAAGFLPTAGIGAGMAMESAWVLAAMLERADHDSLSSVLARYEREQRPRVESAQSNSRQLASLMFRRNLPLALIRDLALRLVSVDVALRPIQRLLATRPDPRAA